MKKSFLFSICAVISVIFLISCNSRKSPAQEEQGGEVVSALTAIPFAADGSIVYVNLDSLTQNYLLTKDLAAELQEKANKLEAELTNKGKKFEANLADLQNKAQKGLETRAKLAEMEQQLGVEQQNLLQLRDNYSQQMAEEQAVMQRKIVQAIMDYLKEYNADRRYKFILGDTFDAKILYADPSLDITAPVLEGINAKYKAQSSTKK